MATETAFSDSAELDSEDPKLVSRLLMQYHQNSGSCYVHPKEVCFRYSNQKANYRDHELGKHLDVYSRIWAKAKGGKKNWVMAFRT